MSIFGPIVTGRDVRLAVEGTIKLWIPDYLAEVSRQAGRAADALPTFKSYFASVDTDRFTDGQLPSCVIVAPGLSQPPERRGSTEFAARWAVGVVVIVVGPDHESTMELVELYAAAVRTLLVQQPSLGGFADGVVWDLERYDEVPTDDTRSFAMGVVQFYVDVLTAGRGLGPSQPSEDPGDWPTVASSTVVVEEHTEE